MKVLRDFLAVSMDFQVRNTEHGLAWVNYEQGLPNINFQAWAFEHEFLSTNFWAWIFKPEFLSMDLRAWTFKHKLPSMELRAWTFEHGLQGMNFQARTSQHRLQKRTSKHGLLRTFECWLLSILFRSFHSKCIIIDMALLGSKLHLVIEP